LIIRVLNKLFTSFGFRIVTQHYADACPSYARLDKLPSIRTVIDVGVGEQGTPYLYRQFEDAFFVSIDPLREAEQAVKAKLTNNRSVFFATALGSKAGEVEMEVSTKPSRSSLLRRVYHDKYSTPQEKRCVSIRTLDSVIAELGSGALKHPVLLKIDTEGYELEVLRGASEVLKEVSYVVLEAPLTQNFEGSYTLSELIRFMAESGFEVFQVLKAGNNNVDLLLSKQNDELRRRWSYGNNTTG
jgi:FkbM family methyltransferase